MKLKLTPNTPNIPRQDSPFSPFNFQKVQTLIECPKFWQLLLQVSTPYDVQIVCQHLIWQQVTSTGCSSPPISPFLDISLRHYCTNYCSRLQCRQDQGWSPKPSFDLASPSFNLSDWFDDSVLHLSHHDS